ncbi:hypothetical protein P22_0343 [Propionispora sp. 2/2-37]|uniref:TIGR03960 family B12-binding radical SAM protein n=1 Tax=Propionispora sp. 2/2-37 TaxID=1677858 RepID=UPI0006BB92F6|nr:TIGR03960 family B12-binding radical SAM protein [Propionispora sp. 2/2-37]CUH94277.1 hypothetical protein P22_0343 [Propionispora sp. 2/2-37]
MSWLLKEELQEILRKEEGAIVFPPGSRNGFALIYPNSYYVGMSNLGFHIIYKSINNRQDTACERLFLPDKKSEHEYSRTNTPLMTIETQRPLYEFPLIGFAVTFEMDYFNILKILTMGKVPLLARDRTERDPFVMIGGPCATFNPEPLAEFVDLCIIGEGEEVIHNILDTYYLAKNQGLSRREILLALAQIKGVYVPLFYEPQYNENGTIASIKAAPGVPTTIYRRWVEKLDDFKAQTVILTSNTEFGNMFLIEIARGCGRHCRFCMAGYCFRRPRIRSLANIKRALYEAKTVHTKVGLMGAAISDHPDIDAICETVLAEHMTMSVASLRADSLTPRLVHALAASNHKTVTLAPEAGSARMRRVINKGITDEHVYEGVRMAIQAGIPHIRLYIMIDLPFEEDEDIEQIVTMANTVKTYMQELGSKGKLTLSINPFIPKPFTPFQWLPVSSLSVVENKLKYIQAALKKKKNIEVLIESPKEGHLQGILARGDRRLGKSLLKAHELGGYRHFKRAMRETGLTEDFYLYRQRHKDEVFPWHHLHMGFDPEYLWNELQRAKAEKGTSPCQAGCVRCGVCKRKEEAKLNGDILVTSP